MFKFNNRERGISLVELIIFIVIVSVGLTGVLVVLTRSTATSADPLQRKQALAIAEALMEELQLARFTFCTPNDPTADTALSGAACTSGAEVLGPELDDARPFDNLNDYVTGWDVPNAAFGTPPVDVTGAAIAPVGNYAATVTLNPYSFGGIASAATPGVATDMTNVNALRVTVRVTYGNDAIELDAIRTRYAPRSLP